MIKVSVIIAAHNEQQYISRAIKSIQKQTFQDFEIIVCDDCSTDKTVEVIQKLMKHDDRIILLQNEVNMKSAATRNKGLKVARGEYIAIQDADDYSHTSRLEEQVSFLDNNPIYNFVSSLMYRFDETGLYNISKSRKKAPENKDFLSGVPYAHAPTMFRKTAICSVGGYRVSKETVRGEDADLFMRLHANGSRGYNLNKPLYYYFEGKEAYTRKKIKYRLHSIKIRYKGFKVLDLMPLGYVYMFKPLLVGLIPIKLLRWYKKNLNN